ncbi:hypothetical protein C8F04DRAFT_1187827 [Mycena alexandri]|uniref:Uncharacterized protein n=1 Tax=Mycena alexandri TaxID=1745969 RepID=A0AAD6SJK0_9AGAR|nr:hypothetical protein C8F04DRAFT_1187827 [Mycena alexandri]
MSDGARRTKLSVSTLAGAKLTASGLEVKQTANVDEAPEDLHSECQCGPTQKEFWNRANAAAAAWEVECRERGDWFQVGDSVYGCEEAEDLVDNTPADFADNMIKEIPGEHPTVLEDDADRSLTPPPPLDHKSVEWRGRCSIRLPTPVSNSPSPEPKGRLGSFYDMLWKAIEK